MVKKGRVHVFEYEVSETGSLIPQTLEGRIYLAHLYVAQKRYSEAAALIKAISMSETLSEKVTKALHACLNSSEKAKISHQMHVRFIFWSITLQKK